MDNKKKAILCMLLSAFCFCLMNLFVRLSGDLPVWQKSVFRNLVAAIIAVSVIMKDRTDVRVGRAEWLPMTGRCIAGTIGILCNFFAVSNMNIADATMLSKMSPFFAIFFSIFIMKEKPKRRDWLYVIIAFAGALLVLKPTFNLDSIPAFAGFAGGMAAGFAYTCVRKLGTRGVKGPVIVLYFSVSSCIAVLPGMMLTYQHMETIQLVYLILAGIAAAGGQFSITAAYSRAPAREVSVYDYSMVVFAAFFSLTVLHEIPDIISVAGYFVIIGVAIAKWRNDLAEQPQKNG